MIKQPSNSRDSAAVITALVDYLDLEKYGIPWNDGERSIPQSWSVYRPRRFVHFALLSLYEFASASFAKNCRVLDFGCGVGYGSYRLGVRGAKYDHGIELDEHVVNFGRDHFRYHNVLIECSNIKTLHSMRNTMVLMILFIVQTSWSTLKIMLVF
jgi:SAM-dependent methyltransferase